jgi:hypothetical protein
MKTWRPLLPAAALAAVVALPAGPSHAQQAPAAGPPAENTGPNRSITRWAEGEYAYLEAATGARRGFERFRLTVHPDGSRTLLMWHDLAARDAQFTVMLRTAASFRPLEASVSYWNAGQYKGFASLMVDGGTLHLSSTGSYGTVEQEVEVPAKFSIGSHPISGDGWHLWLEEDPGQDPASFQAIVFGLDAAADPMRPITGRLTPMPVERIGAERITVPAGTFDTVHYRIAGRSDVWIHGEDRMMIRMRMPGAGLEYVLSRLETGP